MAGQTPYQRYATFARTVAGIEPMQEEDWERSNNRSFVPLPPGSCKRTAKAMMGADDHWRRRKANQTSKE